jgi:hypothetical protein
MITTVGPFIGSKYQQFDLVLMMGVRYSAIDFLQCDDVRSRIDENLAIRSGAIFLFIPTQL